MRKYSEDIVDKIREYLDGDDWKYEYCGNGIFKFHINLRSKINILNLVIDVKNDGYITYAMLPVCTNKERNDVLSEFIHRANYGLVCGNFEYDVDDGEIRYKSYCDCEGIDIPTDEMIRNSISIPVSTVDRYSDSILRIIVGKSFDAREEVERSEHPEKARPVPESPPAETSDSGDVLNLLRSLVNESPDLGEDAIEALRHRLSEQNGDDNEDNDSGDADE